MNILEVSHVEKHYKRFQLRDVDMAMPQGCIMGLIGENGAGKSTLLKCILGLVRRDGGNITFRGEELDADTAQMEEIGVVFDTLPFHGQLTPAQVGKLHKGLYKNWDNARYLQSLKRFGLPEKEKIKGFSKGMLMKLGIAAALSHNARLLLLDEPTAGLDPIARDDLMDIFLEFVQDETHGILLSTHITADLERVADYVTFLHEGRVLFTRPKDDLRDEFRLVHCGEADFRKLREEPGAIWRKQDTQYEVLLPDGAAAARRYPGCQFDRPTIDEIMLMYVKGGTNS